MTEFVERTCTEIKIGDSQAETESMSLPVEQLSEAAAYVLLGAPGSGKTKEFERQAAETRGHCVTAREFIALGDDPAWHDVTLFIDGLDEVRAGSADGRTPFDAIRAKLAQLGRPQFRLSCREADWFGSNDRDHLKAVSPDGTVRVLHLDPILVEDAKNILQENFGIEDPSTFIRSARKRGVDALLVNPQSLEMLARAVTDDDWPSTRTQTFELACKTLASERNQEHRIAVPEVADIVGLMRAAGKLFAVQLLTGAAGYVVRVDSSDRRHAQTVFARLRFRRELHRNARDGSGGPSPRIDQSAGERSVCGSIRAP